MKKKVTITYSWDNTENVSSDRKEILQEDAMERIVPMMKDGFTSGELHSVVDNKEYSGYWSVNTEIVETVKEIKSIEKDLNNKLAEYKNEFGRELANDRDSESELLLHLLRENKTISITFQKSKLEGEDYPETAIMVTLEGANNIQFRSSETSENYTEFANMNGYEEIATVDDLREFLEEIELRGEDGEYDDEELMEVIEFMDSYINSAKAKDISEFYQYLVEKE